MATLEDVLSTIDANQGAALDRLFSLVEIPSISAHPRAFPRLRARRRLAGRASSRPRLRGLAGVDTPGRPMVMGSAKAKTRDAPHVLFYGHYDVQPADPLELWKTPPFEPRLESGADGRAHRRRAAPPTTRAS